MNIAFKDITDSDFTEVKNIYDWYIAHSTATFHTEPILESQLREFIYVGHTLYPSYLIYLDGEVAGYCYLTCYRNRQAYIRTAELTIYLRPEYCRKGLGAAAVRHLEQKARTVGLKNLIATISGDNQGSIGLFGNMGYTQCAHFKNIGEKFEQILDVVVFQKEI